MASRVTPVPGLNTEVPPAQTRNLFITHQATRTRGGVLCVCICINNETEAMLQDTLLNLQEELEEVEYERRKQTYVLLAVNDWSTLSEDTRRYLANMFPAVDENHQSFGSKIEFFY